MAKNIIFCADGTWNNPGESTDKDNVSTNVYALFNLLKGKLISSTKFLDSTGDILELEKSVVENGTTLQIAKYINGVGNSKNKILKLLGGGFGSGLVARVVRGYTFISRNYEPGDAIYIVGFSRGAYTARALAGMIAAQGLLKNKFNRSSADAYKLGTCAWYHYRKENNGGFSLADFTTAIANFDMREFLLADSIDLNDFAPIAKIKAVGVWDTVGSMGIPKYDTKDAKLVDTFRFANTKLSDKVQLGLHAIALDEQRLLFTPTLWDAAGNVAQMVFAGGHADVGGGYAEKGLSDITLEWFIERLSSVGMRFDDVTGKVHPSAGAPAHQEWRHITTGTGIRLFKLSSEIVAHVSIAARMALVGVQQHLGDIATPYRPKNWPPAS
jgi:uncharacterized protein (DUF2235 family)